MMQQTPETHAGEQALVERINILRGIAIIGVLAIHTSAHFQQAAFELTNGL